MRPKKEFERVLAMREADGRLFFRRYHRQFVKTRCPACGSGTAQPAFERLGFRHEICKKCSTLFCSPRPTEKLLAEYYNCFSAPKFWTRLLLQTSVSRKALQYEPRARMILAWLRAIGFRRGNIAIDYGCGSGAFAKCLQKTGYFKQVIGLDFSEDCVRTARAHGVEAYSRSLNDLEPASVDTIFANDLIEHLYDPRTFLRDCKRVLRQGGTLFVATPNGEGFDFKVLKDRAPNVAPPEHLNYFNPASITLLFQNNGFQLRRIETPGRLDVDIVRRAVEHGFPLQKNNAFLADLLKTSDAVGEKFQDFLAQNGLSSHMLVMAQKR